MAPEREVPATRHPRARLQRAGRRAQAPRTRRAILEQDARSGRIGLADAQPREPSTSTPSARSPGGDQQHAAQPHGPPHRGGTVFAEQIAGSGPAPGATAWPLTSGARRKRFRPMGCSRAAGGKPHPDPTGPPPPPPPPTKEQSTWLGNRTARRCRIRAVQRDLRGRHAAIQPPGSGRTARRPRVDEPASRAQRGSRTAKSAKSQASRR